MAILNNNPLVGASGNQGGYNINNSLRLRSSASAYLNRTPASAGNRQIWTISVWVKRGTLGIDQKICSAYSADSDSGWFDLRFTAGNVLYFGYWTSAQETVAVYRDPSAWYHIVVAVDSTQATASNRVKMYVNGTQVTVSGTAFAQNTQLAWNNNVAQNIGRLAKTSDGYFDGYLAEFNSIDGQALTPSSFGETDTTTGVWKPKAYTGTYGTNGFYLKFSDIATTSGSNAGLGKDFSGNSNYWTTNNISVTSGVTYDAMTDSPTNTSATVGNFATLNPLNAIGTTATFSNANLSLVLPDGSLARTAFATMGVSSGKYYWEMTVGTTAATYYPAIGVNTNTAASPLNQSGADSTGYMYMVNGQKFNNGSLTSYGATYATNDVIGVALDMDAGTITFYKNNASQGQAFSGLSGTAVPCFIGQVNASCSVNFGQRPFAYTPPTGYVALNTYNLPTPTIKAGNKYMDATLYTGNGSTQSITNAGAFRPDFVWIKRRDGAGQDHVLQDSNRGFGGTTKLASSSTAAENTTGGATGSEWGSVTAANSNGFSITASTNGDQVNKNTWTYVGWQWQAGQGSTSSNTSGSITSTVSVNTTAGFSIVTYTGTGSAATIGHGLGVAPRMIIAKRRNTTQDWGVYHASVGNTGALALNLTIATDTNIAYFNNTSPTSSVFSVGTGSAFNANTGTYVAYCWAAISGFSAFGSYTGNGNANGSFIYTGFQPKFVMIKRTDAIENWVIWTPLAGGNGIASSNNFALFPNLSNAQDTTQIIDALSNGFKQRDSGTLANASGGTYIYMAFAENPFKNSLAR